MLIFATKRKILAENSRWNWNTKKPLWYHTSCSRPTYDGSLLCCWQYPVMILNFIPQYYGKSPPYPTMILNIPTTRRIAGSCYTTNSSLLCYVGISLNSHGLMEAYWRLVSIRQAHSAVKATDLVVATCLRIAARDPNGGGCWCRRRRKRKVEKRDKGWLKTLVRAIIVCTLHTIFMWIKVAFITRIFFRVTN